MALQRAMAKIFHPPNAPQTYPRSPNSLVIVAGRNGDYARAAPSRRSDLKNPAQIWLRKQFGLAGRMAANPTEIDYAVAAADAVGTTEVARDHLTAAAYGTFYEVYGPDGRRWLPSSKLYQAPDPQPQPTGVDDMMNWGLWDDMFSGTVSTSSFATKGNIMTSIDPIFIRGAGVLLNTIPSGALYRCSVWTMTTTTVLTTEVASANITPPTTSNNIMFADFEVTIPPNTRFAILITRTDSTSTYQLPIRTGSNKFLYPLVSSFPCTLASVNPTAGNTLNPAAAGSCSLGFRT